MEMQGESPYHSAKQMPAYCRTMIQLSSPAGSTRNAAKPRFCLRSSNVAALLLSLGAHLILPLFVDGRIIVIRNQQPNRGGEQTINIRFTPTPVISTPRTNAQSDAPPQQPAEPDAKLPEPMLPEPPDETQSSIFDILVPPTPYYFQSKALTTKPKVSLDIPANLGATLSSDLPGSAKFRLQINEYGEVDQVIVDESSFSETDQAIVVAAFQKIKFEPGKIDDQPVKSELRIEVISDKNPPVIEP